MKSVSTDFKIEVIVTVAVKGQIVVPKNVREKTVLSQTKRLLFYCLRKIVSCVVC